MAAQKRGRFRWVIIAVLGIVLIYAVVVFIQQEAVLREQKAQITRMEETDRALQTAYEEMLDSAKNQETREYIESYMRQRFGMVGKDEVIIDVQGEDSSH